MTVVRQVPERVCAKVNRGEYKVCGGVVRNQTGQIVVHLVTPGECDSPVEVPVLKIGALNSYSIQRIGRVISGLMDERGALVDGAGGIAQPIGDTVGNLTAVQSATNQLVSLSTGTMLLSGLTFAVSSAGFLFLNKKLNRIDQKLSGLQKDVKEIKAFLNTRQRAELTAALNTLRDVGDAPSDETRRQLLVHTRQTLGTLYHYYRTQFMEAGTEGGISAAEEYFTITALGRALCAGELEMYETAARDIEESYGCWSELCRKTAIERLFGADPQRFLCRRYAAIVRSEELIDWMEFAHHEERGLEWIDTLRGMPSRDSWLNRSLTQSEILEIELFRRMTSRNRIYQGYCSQYQYLRDQKIRPLDFQARIEKIDRSFLVDGTLILVSNEFAGATTAA